MKPNYRQWLQRRGLQENTIIAQMHRAGRVEEFHGNLDEHYDRDRMASLIETLRYSTNDKRHGRPNPSNIPFDGDTYSNLASYRHSAEQYRKFRDGGDEWMEKPETEVVAATVESAIAIEEQGQRIGLERDMQGALRTQIAQLEQGLMKSTGPWLGGWG
jgi:hypothetical protein